jgi:hypothetical protein
MDTRQARTLLLAAVIVGLPGCSAAVQPTPQVIYVTPAPTEPLPSATADKPSDVATASPEPAPTATPSPAVETAPPGYLPGAWAALRVTLQDIGLSCDTDGTTDTCASDTLIVTAFPDDTGTWTDMVGISTLDVDEGHQVAATLAGMLFAGSQRSQVEKWVRDNGGRTVSAVIGSAVFETETDNDGGWRVVVRVADPGEAVASPGPAHRTFGDGIWLVGEDIKPGTYRTRTDSEGCYWARLRDFSGDGTIANELTDYVTVVTVKKTDKGFESSDCEWTSDLSRVTGSMTTFGPGMFIVGTDIKPGRYRSTGGEGCYWERLRDFSGDGTIDNDLRDGPAIVDIKKTDKGFKSQDCGSWNRI